MASQVGLVKVGVSSDLVDRKRRLQDQSGLALEVVFQSEELQRLDAYTFEKFCHFALDDYRSHGEWFECPTQVAIDIVRDALEGGASTRPIPPVYIEGLKLTPPMQGVTPTSIAKRGAFLAMH